MYAVKPLPLSMWFNESFQPLRHFANKDRLVLTRTLRARSFSFCYTGNQPIGQNGTLCPPRTYVFQQYAMCYELVTQYVISNPTRESRVAPPKAPALDTHHKIVGARWRV